ncbi:MAG TPA: hypothetical protein VHA05_01195 [Candidatus Saccharimonadales bacterium]|nr:hypothetical protein [Candidatus Saccharimonadales bacterium]
MYISHQKERLKIVGKKRNIIEINGRRYDAHTGAALDHAESAAASTVVKPITVKHAPSKTIIKPVKHHPQHSQQHSHKATRQAAKAVTPHKQQRSTTLMRRAVHKPGASLKRHVKVQSDVSALIEQPILKIAPKLSFNAANPKRLELASKIRRSESIKHFNPNQQPYAPYKVNVTVHKPAPQPAAMPKAVPRQAAPDLDDIFERAIQNATSHLEQAPKKPKKRRLHLGRRHVRA